MNELKKRLQYVSPRERRLLIGCVALLVVVFVYYVLWQPWLIREDKWRTVVTREKNTVEWMKQQVPNIKRREASMPEQGEPLGLSAAVTRTSAAYGVSVTRLQPQGERLAVTLAPVEFNALMQWLTQLERRHRIRTMVFDVAAQGNPPGQVTVNRLVLSQDDVNKEASLSR
ncbi:type II secretion system protein M [Escherichia coli]|nr:type II secretion system protein M [Escherichia coli]EGE6953994.1 type II secretion system protein M [Escherichia coli]